jgi:hypothetical protein
VEQLWQGHLDDEADALNALIIVDQLHKFAVTTHRDFVIKHLEPWLQLAEEELPLVRNIGDGCTPDDLESLALTVNMLERAYSRNASMPLWKELEDHVHFSRLIETRRNKELDSARKRRRTLVPDRGNEPVEES